MSDTARKKILADPDGREKADAFNHVTSLRVPFFEVDMGQALYHGNYYHLFEVGREEILRKIGFPYREFMNRQLHLTIIEARCKYRQPLRYDDQIELHTAITALGRRNLSFSQLIYRRLEASQTGRAKDAGSELCTECRLDMVCVQFTGRLTLLPEDFRKAAAAMVGKP